MGKAIIPDKTTPKSPAIVNRFPIPTLGGNINFAVNNTYSSAALENNIWLFADLCIDESTSFERFEILSQNSDLTIFSCTTVRTAEFQSIRLDYTVDKEGKQVLNFGSLPEEGGRVEWRVICENALLTEGSDWNVSDNDKTITVNGAKGAVNVIRYYFSESLDRPDLTFIEQHYVTIIVVATTAAILAMAVFIKAIQKNRGDDY
jgi:hypothetical protein